MKTLLLSGFLAFAGFVLHAQVDLVSDLKVCMPFKGNANDYSGNGNNGTTYSVTLTTDRFGHANNAYHFVRNAGSYISAGTFSSIVSNNELTISMWGKADTITANCLFMLDPDNPSDRCVGCAQYITGATTMMVWDFGDIYSTGGRAVVSNIAADTVNWHHYVYTISSAGNTKKMYKDGQVAGSTVFSQTCVNRNLPFYIGGGYGSGGPARINWSGKIDDVCIYNRSLDSAEVNALYHLTTLCLNTVGLEELAQASNMLVYPTVSEGVFNVISRDRQLQQVEIYSADGKKIRTQTIGESSVINISGCEKGIYFLRVSGRDRSFVQKVIVQ